MTEDLERQILARLTNIEKRKHAPSWLQVMIPIGSLVIILVGWGVSVESRVATMQNAMEHLPGNSWLKDDVLEIKANQKEILSRVRDLEIQRRKEPKLP